MSETITAASQSGQSAGQQSFYARQATGLIREISIRDAIALNISFVGIIYAVLVATEEPVAFPGGYPFWSTLIAGVLAICPTLLYGLYAAIMPRSGGDYVFVSRSLHPWIGFAANFNITAWMLMASAFSASVLAPFGLSTAFSTLAAITGNSTYATWATRMTDHNWQFAIGAVAIVLSCVLLSFKLGAALKVIMTLFLLSLVSVVIGIVLMAIHTRADFIRDVASFGGSYTGIIAAAHKAGYGGDTHINAKNTFLAFPLAFTALGFAIMTAYAGGEVRSAKKSILPGMLYSLAIATILSAVTMALADRTFGNDFLGSATYLSNSGSKAYPFASPAFFFFFVSMLTKSTFVTVLILVSFLSALLVGIPAAYMAVTRSIFAWSFDRIVPSRLSDVNETTHSPLVANLVVMVVALGFLAFMVYSSTSFVQLLYTIGIAQMMTFMVVGIAGMIFPWRHKDLFAASPLKAYVGPVPMFVIVAAISFVVWTICWYVLLTTDALGANARNGIEAVIVIGVIGLAIYPISYLINRARGIDLNLSFRTLPPE